ncbi:hypothetical protein TOPH_07536 [Tolypocladium ophioglossoides CBS 100239]|uniref:Uncharacterized protein n=1 Tax=Tolypocladium ophioglossoides (strain CBS 100239) TaxID=1163406 RepID=A0A0L0N125_TOLOC|nr:hypothetical protein TOPH_07536 [Tolypocladium ophioglossoides CBS 100239]
MQLRVLPSRFKHLGLGDGKAGGLSGARRQSGGIPRRGGVAVLLCEQARAAWLRALAGGPARRAGYPGELRAPRPSQGIWYGDASRAEEIPVDCRWVTVEDIVQAMYELIVDEEYGDGTILEVTPGEARVVPMFNAPPPKLGAVSMPRWGRFTRSCLRT